MATPTVQIHHCEKHLVSEQHTEGSYVSLYLRNVCFLSRSEFAQLLQNLFDNSAIQYSQ